MNFSVLMSVYSKEKPNYLEQSLRSVMIDQTLLPSEVILVKDGLLTIELDDVIKEYRTKFPHYLKVIELSENQGLGIALNTGLNYCNYELVARMDTDDICAIDRFEKQIKCFIENDDLDLVGGGIIEFDDSPLVPISERKVPLKMTNITQMMKRRNPMNHMTVMFKKSSVMKVGGYKHLPFLEDYYLWIRMVELGCTLMNLSDILVQVRTGDAMYKRRGNKSYIGGWYVLQKKMRQMGMLSVQEMLVNMVSIIGFSFIPIRLKKIIYSKLLRN